MVKARERVAEMLRETPENTVERARSALVEAEPDLYHPVVRVTGKHEDGVLVLRVFADTYDHRTRAVNFLDGWAARMGIGELLVVLAGHPPSKIALAGVASWERLDHHLERIEASVRDLREGLRARRVPRVAGALQVIVTSSFESLRLLGRLDQLMEDEHG